MITAGGREADAQTESARQESGRGRRQNIRAAEVSDRILLAGLRTSLWPDTSFEDRLRELENLPVA